ncbi:MAG TPA: porin [Candidatus Dormibacteraeota bacterium]|nr:porin [Candidatus Dormibacteraeota bacterium]
MSRQSKCISMLILGCSLALPAFAQDAPPPASTEKPADASAAKSETAAQQAPAPAAAPAPPTWSVGPIDFSGLVDGYYSFNFNHPGDKGGNCGAANALTPALCGNQLYNFNEKPNQFSLNMAKLSMAHSPDPVGFQVDLGFGRAFDTIAQVGEKQPEIFRYIEQAYVSLKPAKAKGLEIDFGKFVTSAGAEVIETNGNWNYSRSLLFSWAIPYYHMGLRTSIPIGKYFVGGVQVVNGWNNVEDNNSGKTIGLTGVVTTKKFAWSNAYYAGPENPGTNKGWRQLFDTTLLLTPSDKLNAYINFDYAQNRNPPGSIPALSKWYGIAAAVHFQPTSKWAFTPRLEWFKDRDGFATGTGVAQDLKEVTLTGEYKMIEGILGRLEYRHDWSNQPFFVRGNTFTGIGIGTSKNQDTLTIGFVAFFGPKR